MKTNSVLIINKEKGMTSRDVVNKLNKIFVTKRIGHTGTLDPIAEGVLVVCINEATKLVELLTSATKEYIAEVKLGISTDTYDITGNVLEKRDIPNLTYGQIKEVLNSFLGKSIQEVPIYSAIKVNGKKLYEYARNNEKVELPKRQIDIQEIELLDYDKDIIKFRVVVSKGTYIRSLIKDICEKLDTIGTMNSLVRTKQGQFTVDQSYTLEEIQNGKYKLLSLKEILGEYPQVEVSDKEYFQIKNGAIIDRINGSDIVVFLHNDSVIGIYKTYDKDTTKMKPYRIFNCQIQS